MQRLRLTTDPPASADRCARELLAAVPTVMEFIRQEMRAGRRSALSVPQFRTLVFVSVQPDPSLSALADHIGLSHPATSRMVDLLVRRGWVRRQAGAADRRRVRLSLTDKGKGAFDAARAATHAALACRLASMSPPRRALISQASRLLTAIFSGACPQSHTPSLADRVKHACSCVAPLAGAAPR